MHREVFNPLTPMWSPITRDSTHSTICEVTLGGERVIDTPYYV